MSVSIYVAAPLAMSFHACCLAVRMRDLGFQVVSTWHDIAGETEPSHRDARADILKQNLEELDSSDVVLALMTGGTPRATFGEVGWALAKGIPVVWLKGPNTNIFDAHPLSTVVDTEAEAFTFLSIIRGTK